MIAEIKLGLCNPPKPIYLYSKRLKLRLFEKSENSETTSYLAFPAYQY